MTGPVAAPVPLVVALDGTLVRSDLLAESLLALGAKNPLALFKLPLWLAQGRAELKRHLAAEAPPDVATLPYRRELVAYLEAEKRRGRTLVLATATDGTVARRVAAHTGVFDATLASDGVIHLAGKAKAARLVAMFGEKGFDYVGNSGRDLPVWKQAREAILVQPSARLRRRVTQSMTVDRVFEAEDAGPGIYFQALRWQHWIKNVLVFLPLLAAHRLHAAGLPGRAILAFVAFSLCAASIYLLNDLLDLVTDRGHPLKKDRPLAAGRLPIGHALGLFPLLLGAAVAVGARLPPAFLVALGLYFSLMLAYCLRIKDIAYLDALLLGAGYALRIVAGGIAVGLPVSPWLLSFAAVFFFSLALLKRYADLIALQPHHGEQARVRGYPIQDEAVMLRIGQASGFMAVLLLASYGYIHQREPAQLASVLGVCVLLQYWMRHLWRLAQRGRIVGDPVVFAYGDRVSQVTAALISAMLLIAA